MSIDYSTPRDFGATGDGVHDDTDALQRWLDSNVPWKVLPYGLFKVSSSLYSTQADVTISGVGKLLANSPEMDVLTLRGANTRVDGIKIDGAQKARYGVYATAPGIVIERTSIGALRSLQGSPRGIYTSTTGGAVVRFNRIWDVGAPGDATRGNGNGMSRAIVMHGTGDATEPSECVGNQISNIWGEEADAIAVLFSDAVTELDAYQRAELIVRGNQIRNSGRRYIKIQASDVLVDGNKCWATNDFVTENPSSVIDVIQGHRVSITRNHVRELNATAPVSVKGMTATDRISGVSIEDNDLLEAEGTSPVVYLSNTQGATVRNNTLRGGQNYVSAGTSEDLIISHNVCRYGVPGNAAFNLTSSVTGKVFHNTIPSDRPLGTSPNVTAEANG